MYLLGSRCQAGYEHLVGEKIKSEGQTGLRQSCPRGHEAKLNLRGFLVSTGRGSRVCRESEGHIHAQCHIGGREGEGEHMPFRAAGVGEVLTVPAGGNTDVRRRSLRSQGLNAACSLMGHSKGLCWRPGKATLMGQVHPWPGRGMARPMSAPTMSGEMGLPMKDLPLGWAAD